MKRISRYLGPTYFPLGHKWESFLEIDLRDIIQTNNINKIINYAAAKRISVWDKTWASSIEEDGSQPGPLIPRIYDDGKIILKIYKGDSPFKCAVETNNRDIVMLIIAIAYQFGPFVKFMGLAKHKNQRFIPFERDHIFRMNDDMKEIEQMLIEAIEIANPEIKKILWDLRISGPIQFYKKYESELKKWLDAIWKKIERKHFWIKLLGYKLMETNRVLFS